MSEHVELAFHITRDDWVAAYEAQIHASPEWDAAARQYRRAQLRQVLWLSPLIIVGGALLVGRSNPGREMYLYGAILGSAFAGFLAFALPRLDTVNKAKRQQIKSLHRADLSNFVGQVSVIADGHAIQFRLQSLEVKLGWDVLQIASIGDYLILRHGGSDGMIIPRRAFASAPAADAFVAQAAAWAQAAQLPMAERIARYVAERDIACPTCRYNLRGMRGDHCPECGAALTIDVLINSPRS